MSMVCNNTSVCKHIITPHDKDVYVLALQVDGMIIPGSTARAWLQKFWRDGEFKRGQITGL